MSARRAPAPCPGRSPTAAAARGRRVTDASVVLGYIDPDYFLGGRMRARPRRRARGDPRATSPSRSASSVEEAAARDRRARHRAHGPGDRGHHRQPGHRPDAARPSSPAAARPASTASRSRRRLGCAAVLVPETGAALAAAGALISDLAAHHQAMFHTAQRRLRRATASTPCSPSSRPRCRRLRGQGRRRTRSWSASTGRPRRATPTRSGRSRCRSARSRFDGPADLAALVADFHAHAPGDLRGQRPAGAEVETVGWNATVRCRIGSPSPGRLAAGEPCRPRRRRGRSISSATDWVDGRGPPLRGAAGGPRRRRARRSSNPSFTTVVVDPGARARRDASGTLVIDGR